MRVLESGLLDCAGGRVQSGSGRSSHHCGLASALEEDAGGKTPSSRSGMPPERVQETESKKR